MTNHPNRSSQTKRNLTLMQFWELANAEFDKCELRNPLYGEARDAYDVGESPSTFAAYASGIEDWNTQAA